MGWWFVVRFVVLLVLFFGLWAVEGVAGYVGGWLTRFVIFLGAQVLRMLGVSYGMEGRVVWVEGGRGVWVGEMCAGVEVLLVVWAFWLAVPGSVVWSVLGGLVSTAGVVMLAGVRVAVLAIVESKWGEVFATVHNVVFNVLAFALVVGVVWLWLKLQRSKR